MNWIKKLLVTILSVVGFITIVLIVSSIYMVHKFMPHDTGEKVTSHSVVVLKLGEKILSEGEGGSHLDFLFSGRQKSLYEIIRLIHEAKDDPRIKGLVIKAEGNNVALSHVQELREAIQLFKQSQKPVYAYSDSLGEGGNGTGIYYLGSVANEIWMQPRGSLNLTGLALESYFVKGLLDDYKMKAQFDRREAYKGIIETYTQKEFSPKTRENLQSLLDDLMDQMISDSSKDRRLEKQHFKDLVDHGPYSDIQAKELKLIDGLAHYDEFKKHVEEKIGSPLSFVSDRRYMKEVKQVSSIRKIALIYVDGAIFGNVNPLGEEDPNSPRQIAKLLNKSLEDKEILGVVLRINSPGGTVTGAETIWHEVKKLHDAKKPIIVSMGPTAASAGYQIAAPATKIVATPATLTGSIGVASGKMIVTGAFEHFDVHWDRIKSGVNAGMWSMTEEFSPQGWQKLEESLDYYYDDFLTKVAEGRKLDKAQVRQVAQGQVWSGRQAKDRHLVDELGGLTKAIELVKKELGLASDESVQVITLSGKNIFIEGLFDFVNEQVTKMMMGHLKEHLPMEGVSLKSQPLYVRN